MKENRILNSIYLSLYLFICFGEELAVTAGYVNLFKMGALVLSFIPLFLFKKCKVSILFLLLFTIVAVFNIIKDFFVPSLLYLIGGPLMAKFILTRKFNTFVLYCCFVFIWFVFLRAGLNNTLDNVLNASDNFVSVLLLFNAICLTIIVYLQNGKIIIIPSLMCLIVSLIATGRGGIICSFILFAGLLLVKIGSIKNRFIKKVSFFVMGITLLFSLSSIVILYENAEALERIRDRGFQDNAREEIVTSYISSLDLSRIVIGYNYNNNSTIHSYNDNPHNSYIKLHAYLGFFFFLFICFIIRSLWIYLQNKEYVLIISIIAILLRGFTDIIFLNHFDFVLYLLVFPAFLDKKSTIIWSH